MSTQPTERQQFITDLFESLSGEPLPDDKGLLMIEVYATRGPEMRFLRDLLGRIAYAASTHGKLPDTCQEIYDYLEEDAPDGWALDQVMSKTRSLLDALSDLRRDT